MNSMSDTQSPLNVHVRQQSCNQQHIFNFSLTCADAKQHTKSLKDTDNLISQDIEPGNGHGKGPYHQHKLHNRIGGSLGTHNKEQEDAEHNCCMGIDCTWKQ